jgi:hypothetical protein
VPSLTIGAIRADRNTRYCPKNDPGNKVDAGQVIEKIVAERLDSASVPRTLHELNEAQRRLLPIAVLLNGDGADGTKPGRTGWPRDFGGFDLSVSTSPLISASCRRSSWDPPCDMLTRMDITTMLTELRNERAQIEEAIISLERLATGRGKRRGRPPAWMAAAKEARAPKRRGRPPGTRNVPKELLRD